ncbi:hypothetical protein GCM10007171_03130 [Dickeya fangzhongdai]|nr:hypothetical protein GCM10007171_03130 [Dickeya fangzhongdai]
MIVARDLDQCIDISNQYGPEHLIIQTRNAETLVEHSSLGLADFQKRMTVQQLSPQGLLGLASTIEIMAQAEQY